MLLSSEMPGRLVGLSTLQHSHKVSRQQRFRTAKKERSSYLPLLLREMDAPVLPQQQMGQEKKIEEEESKEEKSIDQKDSFCQRYFSPYHLATLFCHIEID